MWLRGRTRIMRRNAIEEVKKAIKPENILFVVSEGIRRKRKREQSKQ